LEIHRGEQVWQSSQRTFLAQVVGPHFEGLCRDFALEAGAAAFGGFPAQIGYGVVNDPVARTQIEIDVVVLAAPEPGEPRCVLSLGEAKWGEVMGHHYLERLARARDLLARAGYDTRDTVLACYSGSGFSNDLTTLATGDPSVALFGLDRIYQN
jgi:uncharacterized protein